MALWARLKDHYGDDPHRLDDLKIFLGEGTVTLKYVTTKATVITQTLKSPLRGGGTAQITGTTKGENRTIHHGGAYFALAKNSARFFIGMDAQHMHDFRNAQAAFRTERDRLKSKWKIARRDAEERLSVVDAEIKRLMDNLSRQDFKQEQALRERNFAMIEEKLSILNRQRVELVDVRDSDKPPAPDQSFTRPIQFGDIVNVNLSHITNSVGVEKRRLLAEFGVLPLKPSTIPIDQVISAEVAWNS